MTFKKYVIFFLIIFSIVIFPEINKTLYFNFNNKIIVKNYDESFNFSLNESTIVAIYGDSRWGDKIHSEIVSQILKFNPHVVIHLGDMVNKGDNINDWEKFFEITYDLRKRSYFQVVKGNHENPSNFFDKIFGVKNYYSDFFGYRFIFLDAESGINKCIEFIKNYANEKSIVFLHYPIFTVGPHYKDSIVKKLKILHEIFLNKNVKLVISAHEHNYQHFVFNNFHYIITGGGGAATYNKVLNNKNLTFFSKVHNFVILEFNNKFVTVKSYKYNGELLEEFNVQY